MAEKRAGLKIFHKLLLVMLVVAVIPLAGMLYSISKAEEHWQQNLDARMTQVASSLSDQVDNWVDKNRRSLRVATLLPDITGMKADHQAPVLRAMLKTLEWTYLTFTTGLDGKNISRSDNKPPKNYSDRGYFKQVLGGAPYGYQVLIGRTSGKPALVISSPIHAPGTTKELIGTITLAAHLVDVSEAIGNATIGKTGFAMLLDKDGKAIAHGRPHRLSHVLQDMSNHPAFNESTLGKPLLFEEDGKQVVAYAKKTSNGWTLIVQQDYEDAFAALIDSKHHAMILLAITFFLVAVAALLFARRLVNPIYSLTTVAGDYSRGKLDAEIPGTSRGDELGELARAIERLGVSINMAMTKLRGRARAA